MSPRDTIAPPQDDHASDADLVRLLDGEAAPRLTGDAGTHVAACAECSARLATLRRRSASLAALLVATDPPVPSLDRLRPPAFAARRVPRLRIAAALVIAAAGIAAAATPAVRGWIAARTSAGTVARGGASVARSTPVTRAATGAVVGFAVDGVELTVRVDTPQRAGVLELRAGDGTLATAEVVNGAREGIVVLPGALRVRNEKGSSASYTVTLPPAVTAVVVRVGAAAPRRVSRAALTRGGTIRVPLSSGR